MDRFEYQKKIKKEAEDEVKKLPNTSREEYYFAIVDKLLEEIADLRDEVEDLRSGLLQPDKEEKSKNSETTE